MRQLCDEAIFEFHVSILAQILRKNKVTCMVAQSIQEKAWETGGDNKKEDMGLEM